MVLLQGHSTDEVDQRSERATASAWILMLRRIRPLREVTVRGAGSMLEASSLRSHLENTSTGSRQIRVPAEPNEGPDLNSHLGKP